MIDLSLTSVGWFVMGFGFSSANTDSDPTFIGYDGSNFAPLDPEKMVAFVFGWGFCCAASTIDSGATVGRFRLLPYLICTMAVSWFLYPIAAHWVWAGGWLADLGFVDFAGSSVVHLVGGTSSLCCIIMLGARNNRWITVLNEQGNHEQRENIRPSSVVLAATGTWMLAFGWFAFNSGSTLAVSSNSWAVAAVVAANTFLSMSSAAISMMIFSYLTTGNFRVADNCNAMLAGLVGITGGCATAHPVGALGAGMLACATYVGASRLLIRFQIDDAVDATPVHGACGILGTIIIPFISTRERLLAAGYGTAEDMGIWKFFGVQLLGVVSIALLVSVPILLLLIIMKHTFGIRVSAQQVRDELFFFHFFFSCGLLLPHYRTSLVASYIYISLPPPRSLLVLTTSTTRLASRWRTASVWPRSRWRVKRSVQACVVES